MFQFKLVYLKRGLCISLFCTYISCTGRPVGVSSHSQSKNNNNCIKVYSYGIGVYRDEFGETNISKKFVTPINTKLDDILREENCRKIIYEKNCVDKIKSELLFKSVKNETYLGDTDCGLVLIIYYENKKSDTLVIINKNQTLLNSKTLKLYKLNIIDLLISCEVSLPKL